MFRSKRSVIVKGSSTFCLTFSFTVIRVKTFEISVNGTRRRIEAEGERSLLSVLRDDLDLTGAKYGCGEGQCGACTFLIDKKPTRSCVTPISAVSAKPVTTIEGLSSGERLHPVQQAFIDEVAMQCGYCITGMIMSAVGLLEKTPRPQTDEILKAMEGNMCRCGTYPRIVAAIQKASQRSDRASKGGTR